MSEEENIKRPQTTDDGQPTEKITAPGSEEQPETFNAEPSNTKPLNDLNENMETHAHHLHHAPGKKIWHYFYEFLMLFLAVFCGFIAENIREHYVEQQREKQYMRSMLQDLHQDTLQINATFEQIDEVLIPAMDSSLPLLYTDNFSDSVILSMYRIVPMSGLSLVFSFQNKTEMQLKNSGNLRLVRDEEMLDSLAGYWKIRDILINGLLQGYETTRRTAKDLMYSLFRFDYYVLQNPWLPLLKDTSLQLLSDDHRLFKKLGNYTSNLRSQLDGPFRNFLTEEYYAAVNLMEMIHKKYHIE